MRRLYFLLLLFLFCCKPDSLSQEELAAFISNEDNGLKKSVDIGSLKIEVRFKPTDLIVHQQTNGDATNRIVLDSLREMYKNNYYFVLSLPSNNKDALQQINRSQYSELIQTLSFRMNNYVTLTTAQDTIPVRDFILNRTYGHSNSTDLLFVFDNKKALEKEWVQFNLNELGLGVGNQRFRFNVSDLQSVPQIKVD